MIYYFSATGNSAWVARQIAAATGDRARSIIADDGDFLVPEPIEADETLGLVFPVHAWSAPGLFLEFIDQLSVDPTAFVFAVCTYGDSPGAALKWLAKSVRLDSGYGIAMPNSYIPLFNVDEHGPAAKKIAQAKEALPIICAQITRKESVFPIRDKAPDRWLTRFIPPLFKLISKDKKFKADDSCVSCGRCVSVCPTRNIHLDPIKPTWNGNCVHCMACIHHCPVEAIQYGNRTRRRGRYVFSDDEGNPDA